MFWGECDNSRVRTECVHAHSVDSVTDNRQVLHAATSFQDQSEERDMRRTTVLDDGPEAFGVPEAAGMF